MKLDNRIFECKDCGLVIDRDYNAAINILNIGYKQIDVDLNTVGHTEIYACGERSSGLKKYSSETILNEARKRTLHPAVSLTQQAVKEAPVL